MQYLLYKIYFWKGFSYMLQIDMHLIGTPMLTKFYSCKKWVLHKRTGDIRNGIANLGEQLDVGA
jgi:hypothetical protein